MLTYRETIDPLARRRSKSSLSRSVQIQRRSEGTMLKQIRNRQKGFTLIELLIVVAIIGIIAALLIPNFLDALQKAKQKRTVADVRNTGTAMFSWLTDQVGAAAAGAAATDINLASYGSVLQASDLSP